MGQLRTIDYLPATEWPACGSGATRINEQRVAYRTAPAPRLPRCIQGGRLPVFLRTALVVVAAAYGGRLFLEAATAGVIDVTHGGTTISMSFVEVAAPGGVANPKDQNPIAHGSVAYDYRIGQFEVTAGQWCSVLNAAADTDAGGMYNPAMVYTTTPASYGCNILRSGSGNDVDPYTYSVASDWANRPVNYVSWYDAARYCNWLTTGNTETGVYDTSAEGWGSSNAGDFTAIMDHQDAAALYGTAFFLPTEDEWYKAAYYDPVAGVYYDYPTGSNEAPTFGAPPGGSNSANYYDRDYAVGSPYYRSNVGAYSDSASPFMTYDQGGNVQEWNEALLGSRRGMRGGSFCDIYGLYGFGPGAERGDMYGLYDPTAESAYIGFRVASISIVPEPGSLGLLALAGLLGLKRRRRT